MSIAEGSKGNFLAANTVGLNDLHLARFEKLKEYRRDNVDFDGFEETLYGEFVQYLNEQTKSINEVNHYVRYCSVFRMIYSELKQGEKIGEAGGFSAVSKFLVDKGFDCVVLHGDLRYEIRHPDNQLDTIFSFETLEHIKDHNSDAMGQIVVFNFSGMKTYISEMARTLKPEGRLMLTTPNPHSLLVMNNFLRFNPVFMAPVHVRELTKSEILELMAPYFDTDNYEYSTMDCYQLLNAPYQALRPALHETLTTLGADTDGRGDCHYFNIRKKK